MASILVRGAVSGAMMVAGTPARRAQYATPCAMFPAEAVSTPRASSSRPSSAMALAAPRILNEPMGCKLSSLSQTSAAASAFSRTSGVRAATPAMRARAATASAIVGSILGIVAARARSGSGRYGPSGAKSTSFSAGRPSGYDLEMSTNPAAMNPNQALWEKGNFSQIAGFMRESGEALVAALGVRPGMRVLDVGCGDGTTALPSARAGASVLGVDISRPLVAAANARAREAGLANLKVQEGDACNLEGVPDAAFDLATS